MTQITISDDLARQIANAAGPIVFVDTSGRQLAEVTPVSQLPLGVTREYEEELRRRLDSPRSYSTLEEIKARLGWHDQG